MFAPSLVTLGISLSILLTLGACTSNNTTDSSVLSFQFSVLSSNGTDLTSSMTILHSHLTPSKVQRRSHTSVPILQCPLDGTYTLGEKYISRSWCQHRTSPQAYETLCIGPTQQSDGTYPQYHLIDQGNCADDEICVGSDSESGVTGPVQAYCVSTDQFVRIGQNPSGLGVASSAVVTANLNPAAYDKRGTYLTVEAVVTTFYNRTSLFATSMVMQAQAYDRVWRTVGGGISDCLRCPSVTLAPFPVLAQRVKIDVVLPENSPTGLLWLASY